ncbi:SRPBCC family protein [Actinacidiphila oryziradicis]|uniref:SRPBCC family protein n=1 Tax=Actinacidiphila oryziradicis TaxID=2571141 RepID=A0A4U0SP28_9ACTN|nr:SRPBCC family protein [Actinacidiphila oryziradicis]TKA11790.1 SRPBCC family protein [Actinacidiphila oryziradicis]
MGDYEASRQIQAKSDTVFDVAGHLDWMQRWLPPGMHLTTPDPAHPEVVRVVDELASRQSEEAVVRTAADRQRIEWDNLKPHNYSGWLQVTDAAPDRSRVTVHLSFVGGHEAGNASAERTLSHERIQQRLEEGLERLEQEVMAHA